MLTEGRSSVSDVWEPWMFRCCECGQSMDERSQTIWTKVQGWERKRDQGGTNHVALRRPMNEFMCNKCMTMHQNNLSPLQTSLLG